MKVNLDWLENFINEQKEKGNEEVLKVLSMLEEIEKDDKKATEKMLTIYQEIEKIQEVQEHRNLINIFNTVKNGLQWYDNFVITCYVNQDEEAIKIIKYIEEIDERETDENVKTLLSMIEDYKGDEKTQIKLKRKSAFLSKRVERGLSSEFGALIKIARMEKGLSLNDLGAMTEVSPSYIHRIEKGHRKSPTYGIIEKLASALDLDAKELLKMANVSAVEPKEVVSLKELIFNNTFSINGDLASIELKELMFNITNLIVNSKWDSKSRFEEQLKLVNMVDEFKEKTKTK